MMGRDVVDVMGHGDTLDTQAFYTQGLILEHLAAHGTPSGRVIPVPTRGIPLLFPLPDMGVTVGTLRRTQMRTATDVTGPAPPHRHPPTPSPGVALLLDTP
jgi:hypothetical protein